MGIGFPIEHNNDENRMKSTTRMEKEEMIPEGPNFGIKMEDPQICSFNDNTIIEDIKHENIVEYKYSINHIGIK